jgi:(E)-4-hydroxy-3-methylbut-2-enyl-diphosphate synthase
LTNLMDENADNGSPLTARQVMHEAMVQSALLSAEYAEKLGMGRDKIILSAKVSAKCRIWWPATPRSPRGPTMRCISASPKQAWAQKASSPLRLRSPSLLQQGIGDTIRISLTPEPGGDRTKEVQVAQELLQTMGIRSFVPVVAACPGCGRTTSTTFQELAQDVQTMIRDKMPTWKERYPGVESLTFAVMGCIVNGPGESKHADIGISLPGTGEQPAAPVFIDGKKAMTLRGPNLADDFKGLVEDYIEKRFGTGGSN